MTRSFKQIQQSIFKLLLYIQNYKGTVWYYISQVSWKTTKSQEGVLEKYINKLNSISKTNTIWVMMRKSLTQKQLS